MIGAVVLAAGASRRFGRTSKLLAPLHGEPVLAHVLAGLEQASLHEVVVVTGAAHTRVARLVRHRAPAAAALRLQHNADYRLGMATSLQQGLRALPSACHAALIYLGDMPGLDATIVRRLRAVWHPGLDYARPVSHDRMGHPVLISRRLFAAILALDGDQGARSVFQRVPMGRRRLVPAGPETVRDIDTPAALRACARARSGGRRPG